LDEENSLKNIKKGGQSNMKFGVREICDVVLKAKAPIKIGNKQFYTNEPVCYFDSLKTSSMEGAATTVYAQGGRGNARLVAWEGERTVTFTMEDALISPAGFMILSGAGLVTGTNAAPLKVHTTETVQLSKNGTVQTKKEQKKDKDGNLLYVDDEGKQTTTAEGNDPIMEDVVESVTINLSKAPFMDKKTVSNDLIYVMVLDEHGDAYTEPYCLGITYTAPAADSDDPHKITIPAANNDLSVFNSNSVVLVDYYVEKVGSAAQQINIQADKFGGNYYLEASTLFRNTDGVDMPAEFIIPNCKIQSNFTFTMASSGDPSTFTFTIDAFPDYTRFDKETKVLAAIQIIEEDSDDKLYRQATSHTYSVK
jgi:hypothetical protein